MPDSPEICDLLKKVEAFGGRLHEWKVANPELALPGAIEHAWVLLSDWYEQVITHSSLVHSYLGSETSAEISQKELKG